MKSIDNTASETIYSTKVYQNLFHPKTIAVIGASNDELKPGGRVIKNIKNNGYEGQLWAVNPKKKSILGLPTFSSISTLPIAPDLAIVAIPSAFVLAAIEELADRGTGAVIILTAGFGEKDENGKMVEQKIYQIAQEANMALIGPNCSGFLTSTYKGKFAGIIPQLPGKAVDFISGSGAMVDYVMERASSRGLSFGTIINLGNSVQMGVEDLVQMHDENYDKDSARILMIYMEAINKPKKLLHHARSLASKGCSLIGIKSGATTVGERAAASHTGAMATSDTAVEALFEKAGIIRVQGRGELINVAGVLTSSKGRLKGKQVCIITDAGGPGVILTDALARQGMELPMLKEQTRTKIAKILPPESSVLNPIDALPSRTAEQITQVIKILGDHESDNIDVIVILTGDSGLTDNAHMYQAISNAMQTSVIPILPVLSSVVSCKPKIEDFIAQGNVFYPDEVELSHALCKVAHWLPPEDDPPVPHGYDRNGIEKVLKDQIGVLAPENVKLVLESAGFKLPQQIEVKSKKELIKVCTEIGFPQAMKVNGPLHKTDVGGVKLGIGNEREASEAWDNLIRIPDAKGVLIQPMITGLEVIIGASREGQFGHLVMFGLGGIYAEVLKDVKFALAPISISESMRMIRGIRSYPLLEGVRGEAGMDIDVLSDNLQRIGRLVHDFPRIKEIDLNPVKGVNSDLFVVDSRIIIQK